MPQQLDCKLSSVLTLLSVFSDKKRQKNILKQIEETVHFYPGSALSKYVLLGRVVGKEA